MKVTLELTGLEDGDVEKLRKLLPKADAVTLDLYGDQESLVGREIPEILQSTNWQCLVTVNRFNNTGDIRILSIEEELEPVVAS